MEIPRLYLFVFGKCYDMGPGKWTKHFSEIFRSEPNISVKFLEGPGKWTPSFNSQDAFCSEQHWLLIHHEGSPSVASPTSQSSAETRRRRNGCRRWPGQPNVVTVGHVPRATWQPPGARFTSRGLWVKSVWAKSVWVKVCGWKVYGWTWLNTLWWTRRRLARERKKCFSSSSEDGSHKGM